MRCVCCVRACGCALTNDTNPMGLRAWIFDLDHPAWSGTCDLSHAHARIATAPHVRPPLLQLFLDGGLTLIIGQGGKPSPVMKLSMSPGTPHFFVGFCQCLCGNIGVAEVNSEDVGFPATRFPDEHFW